jgi:hypothetical protein
MRERPSYGDLGYGHGGWFEAVLGVMFLGLIAAIVWGILS